MEFGLSQEQEMLQKSVAGFLEKHGGLERARSYADNAESRADDVWRGIVDLGIPGLIIPEEHGGLGMSTLDAALVAEVFGHFIATAPFAASVVMAPLAIAASNSAEQRARWLPGMAEGKAIAGAALTEVIGAREGAGVSAKGPALNGKSLFVQDFEADIYLVADTEKNLYIVDANAAGLVRRRLSTIDKTRSVGELVFENVAAEKLDTPPDTCDRVIDAGRIMLAADTLGAAQSMLNQALSYSKVREQFGRVIGSFQAVKHMCAEMAANLEPCRPMMWYAAHAFDHLPDESRLTACHTKAHIAEAGTLVAKISTEVHGGIGFTDELGLHYWFKRIGLNRQLLGGPDRVREEAAALQHLA